jgi:hypothetical protein
VIGDQLQRPVQVATDLLVNAQKIGSGLCEGGNEVVRILDHQMAIKRQIGDRPQRLNHGRTEGDVWDEVSVHHVDVDDASAASFGRLHLFGEMGEV